VGWTKKQVTALRDQMRSHGRSDDEIADEIRYQFGCSPLTSYRTLRGWSQEEAANRFKERSRLPLEQATLSRLELWPHAGSRPPQAAQVIALADVYETKPLRLLSPEALDRLDAHERNILLRVDSFAGQSETSQPPALDSIPQNSAGLFSHAGQGQQQITLESQVEMAARRAFKFGAIAEGTNIGPETLQQLFEEVRRISSVYPRNPIHSVLGDLIEAQNVAFVLLEGRQQPNQTRDLYLLAGLLSLMLAKASHDLGDPASAMKQARTAYICADNADHNGLRARIRAQQSLMAYWAGWTSDAARYAALGRDLAQPGSGTAGLWLLAQSARTRAAVGDGESSAQDLEAATRLKEVLEPDDLDAFGGLMRFADCRFRYYEADTRIWIPGQEEAAERAGLEAITAYEEAAAAGSDDWAYGDDAGARADVAFVRAMRGEVDGAEEALAPVLALPSDQRVAGVVASALRVHGALSNSRYVGSRAAGRLRQQIESYGQASAGALSIQG
jgi:transcriptional regulator with XRE-family HTH domain